VSNFSSTSIIENQRLAGIFFAITIIVTPSCAQNKNSKAMKKQNENLSFYGVRYIVSDLDAAVSFYKNLLEFTVDIQVAPGFARLSKGNLHLYLNKPGFGGAGQSMPDGMIPTAGGWARVILEVHNLEESIATLKTKSARFRNELVTGQGGKQILLQDPSGNLVELFEPNEQAKSIK
jgi:catechol 2,3-dioxygenase-like lactoylglutathione lyase family enzyme